MTLLSPASEADLAARIADAHATRTPIEVAGGGSKAGLGAPVQAAATVSTRALSGITLHEPAELVVGARSGTPLATLIEALDAKGQMLAHEPPDWRRLMETPAGEPTVGGMVATNQSGPRRIMSGACRDSLIGVRFVNGMGQTISNGGRVMKNVTGYDLVKLLAGSHGTLGVVTEATFKVVPKPESTGSLVWQGLDVAKAVALMSSGLGSPFEVSGAAHLPGRDGTPAQTILRIENFAASTGYRLGRLADELAAFGNCDTIDDDASRALWADIRDAVPLIGQAGAVWRVSVAPSKAPAFLAAITAHRRDMLLDWGGGLVLLVTEESIEAGDAVRTAARAQGGHASLLRGSAMLRSKIAFMAPATPGLAAVTARIKAAFDPAGILNPGRMGL
ncbi:MAG: FAD-binding protein [bacterium]